MKRNKKDRERYREETKRKIRDGDRERTERTLSSVLALDRDDNQYTVQTFSCSYRSGCNTDPGKKKILFSAQYSGSSNTTLKKTKYYTVK